ncbi:uncharacterized protein BDR25DRAFT_306928 [Lindgomyces ingoldianus]|uniref:Uncharacterized protein n=1 Tax=Lindgomyces ingoldianus TaxID=673940 RepID=A0ACB6QDR8_9PLEO|nr:uncharacterized protein BDR25DRAFT_306928 [Lindgomyces ingoldianus]KAF2465118.1 hypothetical protein BDR25DRAFT_306928 [Lindgomyces ingoldianus]
MADVELPDLCLGIPIDHRLEPLFGTGLTTRDPFAGPGNHAREVESYGHRLQKYRANISDNEVEFAKWLAMPDTKGGVVIVLQQPAEHQRYFLDHRQTVKDCNTLEAVDEVCQKVTGYGLEKISCFDAFPFHKIPLSKSLDEYEEERDEAYAVFLRMIQQKQPDVVFCCYRSPYSTKYKDFQCIGIGRTRDFQVTVQGERYTCVNGFHPSYALNYLEDKSALRSLFIIETTQAFRRVNGTWKESSWMTGVRENCAAIVQIDIEDKQKQPRWTKHDFQRERFHLYMELITRILNSLKSGAYDDMTNDELYDLILEKRYNVLLPNCLLLLVKIINFEDHGGDRLQDKGFTQLRQREDRDVRYLRRNVEKRCDEFLRSLRAVGASFQVEKGGKGLFTSTCLNKSLRPLGPFMSQSGFHYNLRLSFLKFVHILNGAYTYKGRDVYDIDRDELSRAFRLAACHFEWALTQHAASTRRRAPEEDLAISNRLNLLTINRSPHQTNYAARPGISQRRTAPAPSSVYPQSPPSTPPRRPNGATASLPQAAAFSPPPSASSSNVSPIRLLQAASSSQYRSGPTCNNCKQTGHSSSSCPKTQCYRCKNFGHISFDCPVYPSTPQRRR